MKTLTVLFPLPATEFNFAGFAWPRLVAMLPRGTVARRVEARTRPIVGPYYHAPWPVTRGKGIAFYLDSDGSPGMRWNWCDEVEGAGIAHSGWFCDEYGESETIRGVVFRLPKSRGFLAGWSMGKGMASSLESYFYDDEISAANAADSLAENAADEQRQYEEEQRLLLDDENGAIH